MTISANELPALPGFISQVRWRTTVSRKGTKTQRMPRLQLPSPARGRGAGGEGMTQSKRVNWFNQWKCQQCRKKIKGQRSIRICTHPGQYAAVRTMAKSEVIAHLLKVGIIESFEPAFCSRCYPNPRTWLEGSPVCK